MNLWLTTIRKSSHGQVDTQEAFDLLKTCLTSAPVLGYPDFSQTFKLESDASLQGLGTVLLLGDKNGTSHVTVHASRSLWPSEQSM